MGTLASVLEDAGLATVALSIIRGQVETTRPPRALHCEFPLGRPLGRPGDPALQRRGILAWLRERGVADVGFEAVERVRSMMRHWRRTLVFCHRSIIQVSPAHSCSPMRASRLICVAKTATEP